ncbi:transposase [Rhodococcus spelaei]|uniref:transposase n=1 Tax=Rhodococcus spelaei TaxID=2546320 RepID=UPI001FE76846|nr:transposase [Rhodococcus spelaei]
MIVIGIDPHKSTHTATAVDPASNTDLGSIRISSSFLARTGNPTRFANEAEFASYTGTAPVEVASADKQRHRLSRGGDRTLDAAIHIVAVPQARTPMSPGYGYHRRRIEEGKTPREAMRCLKRKVAKRLWRTMRDDQLGRLTAHAAAIARGVRGSPSTRDLKSVNIDGCRIRNRRRSALVVRRWRASR